MGKKLIINCWEEGSMVLDWDPKAYKTKAGGKVVAQGAM